MPRKPASAPPSSSGTRPYYLFTAGVFALGMVLSVAAESWSSFFVFSVLCATFVWVAARADRGRVPAADESTSRKRPSERRRARRQRQD